MVVPVLYGVAMLGGAPLIAFLLLPNFTLTPFALMQDVLRLAADEGDRSRPVRLNWTVLAATLDAVRSSCGAEIRPKETLRDPARFDYVVVCGGLLQRLHGDDPLVEAFLADAHAAGATIVGLCTGSFMLARAGLLSGRRACVSWFHAADFQAEFPEVALVAADRMLVDGPIVTCAGGAGAADVGAWIVERHLGADAARKALDILIIDPGHGGLQPRPAMADGLRDPRLRRVVLEIEERIDGRTTTASLAKAAGVSPRQLERLFHDETGLSPSAFVATLRLRHADWLMRTTDRSLTQIAIACGFTDVAHLSRRYTAAFGTPPSRARRSSGYMGGERRPYRR